MIVRGLRNVADFEYEHQIGWANSELAPDIELCCLFCAGRFAYLSATILKEVASLGGNVTEWAPTHVLEALSVRYNRDLLQPDNDRSQRRQAVAPGIDSIAYKPGGVPSPSCRSSTNWPTNSTAAPRCRFSSNRIVDASEVGQLLERLRISVPSSIMESERTLQERDRILSEAESEAKRIIAQARQTRQRDSQRRCAGGHGAEGVRAHCGGRARHRPPARR